jgi:hypothetical protein
MKIVIEVESLAELYAFAAQLAGGEPSKPGKKAKPTEPVKGNPDGEQAPASEPAKETPPAAQQQAAQPASEPAKVKLKPDAPAEIVALQAKPGDRETVGKALLKACKPVAEGGLSREVALGLTEKFRPAGNTEKLVKVGMIPNEQLPALSALVLAEYAK